MWNFRTAAIVTSLVLMFQFSSSLLAQPKYSYKELLAEGRKPNKSKEICWWISSWGRQNEESEDSRYRLVTSEVSCGGKKYEHTICVGRIRCVTPEDAVDSSPALCQTSGDGSCPSAGDCAEDKTVNAYDKDAFIKKYGALNFLVRKKEELDKHTGKGGE